MHHIEQRPGPLYLSVPRRMRQLCRPVLSLARRVLWLTAQDGAKEGANGGMTADPAVSLTGAPRRPSR
jgi:hypothetical protein